jgi:hypothetical protein
MPPPGAQKNRWIAPGERDHVTGKTKRPFRAGDHGGDLRSMTGNGASTILYRSRIAKRDDLERFCAGKQVGVRPTPNEIFEQYNLSPQRAMQTCPKLIGCFMVVMALIPPCRCDRSDIFTSAQTGKTL